MLTWWVVGWTAVPCFDVVNVQRTTWASWAVLEVAVFLALWSCVVPWSLGRDDYKGRFHGTLVQFMAWLSLLWFIYIRYIYVYELDSFVLVFVIPCWWCCSSSCFSTLYQHGLTRPHASTTVFRNWNLRPRRVWIPVSDWPGCLHEANERSIYITSINILPWEPIFRGYNPYYIYMYNIYIYWGCKTFIFHGFEGPRAVNILPRYMIIDILTLKRFMVWIFGSFYFGMRAGCPNCRLQGHTSEDRWRYGWWTNCVFGVNKNYCDANTHR